MKRGAIGIIGIAVVVTVVVIGWMVVTRDDTPPISAECRAAIAERGVDSSGAREACPPKGPGTAEYEFTRECRSAIINFGAHSANAGKACPAKALLGY